MAIVPTYNEAENIEAMIRAIRKHAPDVGILVVDDGSPDGTADIVVALQSELDHVSLLRRTTKSGLGGAYRAGLRAAIDAGADVCVQIDADFSHDPVMIIPLVSAVEHGVDLAI